MTWKGRKDSDKTVSRLSAELQRNMESHINSVFESKAAWYIQREIERRSEQK